ncbi:MAG: hypothetical protein RQ856_01065 [Candidatus Izemoplasmatales bacterium]|nr:hypothetical protein [Candidatus Izemoplasmatales bacterium]
MMKRNRFLLLLLVVGLSLSLMGCPEVINRGPQFVQIDGEDIKTINDVTYYHVQGNDFHPNDMIQDLIENQGIIAIDYDQTKIAIGKTRDYIDISENIIVTSFYQVWVEGDDANFDGVVDEADEELYYTIKTDEEGNLIFDNAKIMLVEILSIDQKLDFTMIVTDSDGAESQVSGKIIIVSQ